MTPPLRIGILSDAYEDSASPLKPHDLPCDPRPYLAGHDCQVFFLNKRTAVRQTIALSRQGFDVFINLCDGAWDEDRPGIEVVQALERTGQAFTGATSAFYEPTRESMKRVCAAYGIRTPAAVFARTDADLDRAARLLRFPLIVKHPNSYSSIGLTRSSRVLDEAGLRAQFTPMRDAFGGALVEEFIEGREFTVLVSENPDDAACPVTYQPVEYRFPPGETFKHFDMKWLDYGDMQPVPVADADLDARLRRIGRDLFAGLGGTGYGRCDLRMDAGGELYLLEINPNCGIFYPPDSPGSADAILFSDPAGHRGFLDAILRAALARRARQEKGWAVRADRDGSYGLFATRAFQPGETVEAFEETPHVLVTRQHVERHWDAQKLAWFRRYAYPLSGDVFVTWSDNPEEWKPINHSCDPNAWLDGLDVVARRAIAAGDEITLDYATFCADTMEAFACACGSPRCRGVVRGTDYLLSGLDHYDGHFSPYVQARRARRAGVTAASPL